MTIIKDMLVQIRKQTLQKKDQIKTESATE